MIIKRILLENVAISPSSGAHVATVLLHADTALLSFRASALPHVSKTSAKHKDIVTRALVQDALRQVRRMPEYRNGAKVITIADTAWPGPAKQA
jgi:hypothetical protein